MLQRIKDNRLPLGATGLGGSLAVIVVWLIELTGVTVPPDVAIAIGVVLGAAIGKLFEKEKTPE